MHMCKMICRMLRYKRYHGGRINFREEAFCKICGVKVPREDWVGNGT